MISDLRLPSVAKSALAVTVLTFVFSLPVLFDGRDSIGAVVAQVLVVFLTFVAAVIAISAALGFLIRRSKMLAATYSWTAVGVLAGNAALFVLDYWQAPDRSYAHYWFAPALAVVSVCAVAPALAGQIVHGLRMGVSSRSEQGPGDSHR